MLYTRKGDKGTSGLFRTKKRFLKDSPIYIALGTIDELNSLLGVCRAYAIGTTGDKIVQQEILQAQEALFVIQAELAGSDTHINKTRVDALEKVIDNIESSVGNPHTFVIPGATIPSAFLDLARAVARRAERCVITVNKTRNISAESRAYLNRLSSLLYALARYETKRKGLKEISPSYL
jgi:cob(I)alamin adenosyltransferase